jgi:hypothetical protein
MGFYFASPHRGIARGGYVPTVTAQEYLVALRDAQETLPGTWGARCGRCRVAAGWIAQAQPTVAIRALTEVVQQTPGHTHAHCLLGLAHLVCGDDGAAVRHVEIAFDVAQRKLTSASVLGETLRRQCEMALIRLLLRRLRIKVGRLEAAKALLEEGHAVP